MLPVLQNSASYRRIRRTSPIAGGSIARAVCLSIHRRLALTAQLGRCLRGLRRLRSLPSLASRLRLRGDDLCGGSHLGLWVRGRLSTLLPQTELVSELRALSRVVGGGHGIVDRQAVLGAIFLGRQASQCQVALQRLVGLP